MESSKLSYPQSYNQEEVQKIIELALTRKVDSQELTRDQLWEIGVELGIDLETLQEAEKDWLDQKAIAFQRLEFNQYRLENLKQKAVKYAIVNSFLIVLDLLITNHLTFSLYLLLFWGLGLSLQAWKTFQNKGDIYEKAFNSWRLRQELKNSIQGIWEKIKTTWQ